MDIKENKGVIFKNEKKAAETHPDYRGEINVDGTLKEISLWVNTSNAGKKYFSVSISEPYRKAEPPAGIYEKTGKLDKPEVKTEEPSDDLPW